MSATSNRFKRLAVLTLFCASTSLAAFAQTSPQLTGPGVIVFPRVEVPFLSSKLIIRQGQRDAATNACVYQLDLRLEPGQIPPGHQLGRIQRAHDPDTCRELVEEGVLLNEQSGDSEPRLSKNIKQFSLSTGAPSGASASAAAGAQFSAFAEVLYTDGNNPLVQPFRSITDGIEASHGNVSVTLTVGDCVNTPVVAEYQGETAWLPSTGWSETEAGSVAASLTCSLFTGNLTAKHQNSSSLPFIFDCSDIVSINYSPLRLTLDINGVKQMGGNVFVSGDKTSCGEYLARFERLE